MKHPSGTEQDTVLRPRLKCQENLENTNYIHIFATWKTTSISRHF